MSFVPIVISYAATSVVTVTKVLAPSITTSPIFCVTGLLSVQVLDPEPSNVVVAVPNQKPATPVVILPATLISYVSRLRVPLATVRSPDISRFAAMVKVALPAPEPKVIVWKSSGVSVLVMLSVPVVAVMFSTNVSVVVVALLSHEPVRLKVFESNSAIPSFTKS